MLDINRHYKYLLTIADKMNGMYGNCSLRNGIQNDFTGFTSLKLEPFDHSGAGRIEANPGWWPKIA